MIETERLRQESCLRIAKLLRQNSEALTDRWARLSQHERPHNQSTHWHVLRDGLPKFLRAVAGALMQPQEDGHGRHRILALDHGEHRWQIGWKLSDVVGDYQLLRLVLMETLDERLDPPPTPLERLALNLHLDDSITAAVVAFVEHQELQLKQAHQRLNEFLGVLGHELRNPLNAMAMGLQLIQFSGANVDRSDAEQACRHSIEVMTRLLDDMLDVTRITRGQINLDRRPMELKGVLQRAVQGTRSQIVSKHHRLETHLPPGPVWIDGDATRLEQVVTNLLGNAIKYTEPGGTIRLSLEYDGDHAVILRIRDTGQGIDRTMLPHIFDLFVQGPENTGRGLGIGLALTRMLVELHGGRIEAHSNGLGHGSEFACTLPLLTEMSRPEPAPLPPADRAGGHELNQAPSRRILIVDDEGTSTRMLAALLEQCGHAMLMAYDGEVGLELALNELPEVILLDIGLPRLDGFEVARRLRRERRFDRTIIIAMTGFTPDEGQLRQAHEIGFDHYLVKPVGLRVIQELIAANPVRAGAAEGDAEDPA